MTATHTISPDDDAPDARPCGRCRACCVAPDIPELGKPIDTPCRHLRGPDDPSAARGACRAYETRPTVCRDFSCGWKLGLGDAGDRPDRIGVMVQPSAAADGSTVLTFVELRPNALGGPSAQRLIRLWGARTDNVVVQRRFGDTFFRNVLLTVHGTVVPPRRRPRPVA